MVRFLHTADWQLGMKRYFLSQGTQERYAQARFEALRTIGRVAREHDCRFVLVCGDSFESNQVDRATVAKALDALREVPVPVFMLPGNHDPLNAVSVYRSAAFAGRCPGNVIVVDSPAPIKAGEGVEVVGAPWHSKRPALNPVEEVLRALGRPAEGSVRIVMAHGAMDVLSPDPDAPGILHRGMLEQAIEQEKVHFFALGDRHSRTMIGEGDRIWYSGTPEPTDFGEESPGFVQVVEVAPDHVAVFPVKVGTWHFIERPRVDIDRAEDIERLAAWLDSLTRKDLTIVRLKLFGSLSLSLKTLLDTHLCAAREVFAALEVLEEDLLVVPDDEDFASFGFSGFAAATLARLRSEIEKGPPEQAGRARDALMLLARLAGTGGGR